MKRQQKWSSNYLLENEYRSHTMQSYVTLYSIWNMFSDFFFQLQTFNPTSFEWMNAVCHKKNCNFNMMSFSILCVFMLLFSIGNKTQNTCKLYSNFIFRKKSAKFHLSLVLLCTKNCIPKILFAANARK